MPRRGFNAVPEHQPKKDLFDVSELKEMAKREKNVAFEVNLDTAANSVPREVSFDFPLDAHIPTLQPVEAPKADADKIPPLDGSKLQPLDIDFDKLDAEAEERQADVARLNGADETLHPSEPLEVDATRTESRGKLRSPVEKITALTGGAKEKIGSTFEKSKTILVDRSKELGVGLRTLGLNVVADFEAAGKGIAHAVAHPIDTARVIGSGAERAASYAKYFTDRNVSLAEKSEKMKTDMKTLTENYNKLPFRKKAYITAALIGGSAVAAVAALPTLSSVLASGMYGVRALGGAGFALNRRKGMEARIAKDPEHWLAGKSNRFKNTYAGVLGAAYAGTTAVAGHYASEALTKWFGDVFGHTTVEAPAHPGGVAHGEIMRAPAAAAAGEAITPAPEMPSVDAAHGHGYEYMAKRLWEQLQEKHLDPSQYPEGSDIRHLLEADVGSIDKVVHQIAADPHHHFFNADSTNVRIDANAHMTIDAHGQIHVSDSINGVQAPEQAPFTKVYHPHEAHAVPESSAAPGAPATTEPAVDAAHTPDTTPQQGTEAAPASEHPSETPAAPEAPSAGHEVFTNHFGTPIVPTEVHIYSGGLLAKHPYVFGGDSLQDKIKAISEYWSKQPPGVPKAVVYELASDTNNPKHVYRIGWHLLKNGQIGKDGPTRVYFGPQSPEDFRTLMQ